VGRRSGPRGRRDGDPAKVNKGTALALLCSVQFMVVLDNAIGNVALPSIRDDLGFSDSGCSTSSASTR
jgi:hypothetical protein